MRAWHRMKGRLDTSKHLNETKILLPQSVPSSDGAGRQSDPPATLQPDLQPETGDGRPDGVTHPTPAQDGTGNANGGGYPDEQPPIPSASKPSGGSIFDNSQPSKVA